MGLILVLRAAAIPAASGGEAGLHPEQVATVATIQQQPCTLTCTHKVNLESQILVLSPNVCLWEEAGERSGRWGMIWNPRVPTETA